jgi:hypothetical protein
VRMHMRAHALVCETLDTAYVNHTRFRTRNTTP